VAVVGSCAAGGAAAGCSREGRTPHTARSSATPSSAVRGGGGPPDWNSLARSLDGALLLPDDPDYVAAGHLYNALYTSDSAAIAQCASVSDVQRCLAFARSQDVQVAVRAGGHSYAAYSSGPGLVVDVSPLHGISTVTTAGDRKSSSGNPIAAVGAGTQLIEAYSQLSSQGFLLPGGSCPTVGIAGLALGGGIGVFSRAYGLTCDQIESVTIVTADGVVHRCGPAHDEDLYWACRGGGGGNFGVVTGFEFQVHPIPDAITLFTLEWQWSAAPSVIDAWLRWIPLTPPQLWANCQLYSGVVGRGSVKVTGVFVGSVSECSASLASLTSAVPAATTLRFVGPEDYMRATMIEAGCEGETPDQCGAPVQSPFTAKSSYLAAALPEPSVNALVSALSTLPSTLPGAGGGVVLDAYGGAINQVKPGDTAFVHRDAVACAQYLITYPTTSPTPSATLAASAWLDDLQRLFAPVAQGSYQNYIDPTLNDWPHAYYGTNLPRLQQIKQRYDPQEVFHFAQSIRPAAGG
jgi:hypothetical protein